MRNSRTKILIVLILVLLAILVGLIIYAGTLSGGNEVPSLAAPPEPGITTDGTTESIPPVTTEEPTESALPATAGPAEPMDSDFVRIRDYIPNVILDIRYATENNFTGQIIYDFSDTWLRYGTVKKLMQVQAALEARGLCLKIWDAFRPPAAQFKLWNICPDPTYVSDPNKGFSSHSRGNTVDITVVDIQGNELKMPTGFDDFSALADRDYSDCDPEAAANAKMLEELMTDCGFKGYYGEWWHYSDTVQYDAAENFKP